MRNNIFLYFLLAVFILVVALLARVNQTTYSQVVIGETTFNIDVAESLEERSLGLSGRDFLDPGSGLLFIFPNEDFHGIWMKEMNFPIDIIWLDKNYRVVGLKEGATPESYPEIFRPSLKASYVLEINSGEAKKAKIKLKDIISFF